MVSEIEFPTRVEAEFYQPHYLANQDIIMNCGLPIKHFTEITTRITDGSHITPEYQETGVKFLMVRNLHEHQIDFENVKYITPEMDKFLKQCKPVHGDILLSKVGSIGVSAVVPDDAPDFNIFVSLAVIKGIEPKFRAYISTFLNSRFGRLQAERVAKGISQPDLHLEDIREFIVPIPSDKFADKITSIISKAALLRQKSLDLYADAENLLASELGLKSFELPDEDITTRHISDVIKVKRIDAEFFHPQKAYAKEWLSKFSGNTVGEYFKPTRDIYNPPTQDTGKSILNFDLTHALHYFLDDDGEIIPEYEIGSLKKRIQKNDVVVSRLRSYLKEIAIVEVPQNTLAVGSSEFIVLRSLSGKLLSEVLLVYLRSQPVQTILKWSQDGSNHPRFQENELLAIKVPDQVLKLQDDIRKMIQVGISAHKEAKRLLAEAKSEVEKLIEK